MSDASTSAVAELMPKVTKTVKAKKAKGKKAAPKKAANGDRGPTARTRVFAHLAKKGPTTGPALKDALGLTGVPSFLKDELFGKTPRLRRKVEEGTRGVLYELTAAGRKDHEAGKVDENAAPATGGSPIPNGR
jgi:hypothetical protein